MCFPFTTRTGGPFVCSRTAMSIYFLRGNVLSRKQERPRRNEGNKAAEGEEHSVGDSCVFSCVAVMSDVFFVGKFDWVTCSLGFLVFCDEIVRALCRDFLGLTLAQIQKSS